MMADLQTNVSIYTDNAMVVASPFNKYMASGSTINNLDRIGQSQ